MIQQVSLTSGATILTRTNYCNSRGVTTSQTAPRELPSQVEETQYTLGKQSWRVVVSWPLNSKILSHIESTSTSSEMSVIPYIPSIMCSDRALDSHSQSNHITEVFSIGFALKHFL